MMIFGLGKISNSIGKGYGLGVIIEAKGFN